MLRIICILLLLSTAGALIVRVAVCVNSHCTAQRVRIRTGESPIDVVEKRLGAGGASLFDFDGAQIRFFEELSPHEKLTLAAAPRPRGLKAIHCGLTICWEWRWDLDGHPPAVQSHVDAAAQAEDAGDIEAALAAGERALALSKLSGRGGNHDSRWVLHSCLANLHIIRAEEALKDPKSDFVTAAHHAEAAALLESSSARHWVNYANVLVQGGNSQGAWEKFRHAHQLQEEAAIKSGVPLKAVRPVLPLKGLLGAKLGQQVGVGAAIELSRGLSGTKLSNDPELYHLKGFASVAECQALIALFHRLAKEAKYRTATACVRKNSPHYFQMWQLHQSAHGNDTGQRKGFKKRGTLCGLVNSTSVPRQHQQIQSELWANKQVDFKSINEMASQLAASSTSDSVLVARGEDALVDKLEERIALLTGWRHEPHHWTNGTRMHYTQLLRYSPGGRYGLHTDCSDHVTDVKADGKVMPQRSRERSHTFLLYLNDVKEGGETEFPALNVSINPQQGHAVVFRNLATIGTCNPASAHRSSPVTEGSKLVLQRWYCSDGKDSGGNCGEKHFQQPERSGWDTVCDGVDCRTYMKPM